MEISIKISINIKEMKEEVEKCTICFGRMRKKRKIIKLDCNHKFHQKCIDKWLSMNPKCPLCRNVQIKETENDYEYHLLSDNNMLEIYNQSIYEERIPLLTSNDNYLLARYSIMLLGNLLEIALRNTSEPLINNETPITDFLRNTEDNWIDLALKIINLMEN
jgi:hypothetical protein